MKCQELLALLPTANYRDSWDTEIYQRLANHIRTCVVCGQGVVRLSEAVVAVDVLSCEVCRAHFPGYYDATYSCYASSSLADVDVVEVAIHLGQCATCSEEYHVLVELWDMEEQR